MVLMFCTAADAHGMGFGCDAQAVTSFPPIDTVISPMWPLCVAMKATAAAIWVVVG